MAFEYRLKRRVQFYETDMAGIVHFSCYFRYLEEAEHAMWRDAGRYDGVAAIGTFNAARVSLRSTALPHAIAVDTAALRFTPRTTELATFAGKVGASDLRATGSLDNLLGFLLRRDDLRGRATVSSQLFALDEWKSREKTTEVIPVPPHVEFTLATSAARVTYGALTMANVKGTLRVKDQRVTLDGLTIDADLRCGV